MLTITHGLLLLVASTFVTAGYNGAHESPLNRTFELIGDQICEIFAVVESPKVYESYVKENKIVTWDDCDEKITIINAPTHLRTTITNKETLNPCPPVTCMDNNCHEDTKTEYHTITPCNKDRCTTSVITITKTTTATKTKHGRPTNQPHGNCKHGKTCANHACCGADYECGYGDEFCGKGCHPELGACGGDNPNDSCANGQKCKSYECCSEDYKCGRGCQPKYGYCPPTTTSVIVPSSTPTGGGPGSYCGPSQPCGVIPGTDDYQYCCDSYNVCGLGPEFCSLPGCQPDYGYCYPPSSTSDAQPNPPSSTSGAEPNPPSSTSDVIPTPTGDGPGSYCGPYKPCGVIPGTDNYQYCCSSNNVCGLGPEYCAPPGCQPDYGYCYPIQSSGTDIIPSSTPKFPPQSLPTTVNPPESVTTAIIPTSTGENPPTSVASPAATPTGPPVVECGPDAEEPLCPIIPGTDDFRFCCRSSDFTCGLGFDYCERDCLPDYGYCYPAPTSAVPTATPTGPPVVECGPYALEPLCPFIPGTDDFRFCCRASDFTCGLGPDYCERNCLPDYGYCYPSGGSSTVEPIITPTLPPFFNSSIIATATEPIPPSETIPGTPTAPPIPTDSLACGPYNLCPFIPGTENFRYCCGADFRCGLGNECGPGCQPEYGDCPTLPVSIATPIATSKGSSVIIEPSMSLEPTVTVEPTISKTVVTPTATPSAPITCGQYAPVSLCPYIPGTEDFRYCCGFDSTCGLGPEYCESGCQPKYGYCAPVVSPSSASSAIVIPVSPPTSGTTPSFSTDAPDLSTTPSPSSTPAGTNTAGSTFSGSLQSFSESGFPPESSKTFATSNGSPQSSTAVSEPSISPRSSISVSVSGGFVQPTTSLAESSLSPQSTVSPASSGNPQSSAIPSESSLFPESNTASKSSTTPQFSTALAESSLASEITTSQASTSSPQSFSTALVESSFTSERSTFLASTRPPQYSTDISETSLSPDASTIIAPPGITSATATALFPSESVSTISTEIISPASSTPDNIISTSSSDLISTAPEGATSTAQIDSTSTIQADLSSTAAAGPSSTTSGGFAPSTLGDITTSAPDDVTSTASGDFTSTFSSAPVSSSSLPLAPVCGPGYGFCDVSLGECCDIRGQCGSTPDFCSVESCQPDYGFNCRECGNGYGACVEVGECCNANGKCGSTPEFCRPDAGCDPLYNAPGASCRICGDGYGFCDSGDCCNSEGLCGSTPEFCSNEAGCQSGYGALCKQCGEGYGTCDISAGECCNGEGLCGTDSSFCSIPAGCDASYGASCKECGPGYGFCDSEALECCGTNGLCGVTPEFCAPENCDPQYGALCKQCGPGFGLCEDVGDCCSSAGQCGPGFGYCTDGCQNGFGFPCDNCPFIEPPPPPAIIVDIGLPAARRFCCEWYTIVDLQTCLDFDDVLGIGLIQLALLNPGAVGIGCLNLQVGATYCIKGIAPYFNIQARNSIAAANFNSLEGRDVPGEIAAFRRNFPWEVDTYVAEIDNDAFVTGGQALFAVTGGSGTTNSPPTVRLYGNIPPANANLMACTILDGSGKIGCSADGGTLTVFSICDTPVASERMNLCLGETAAGTNYVAEVELYAVGV